MPPVAAPTSPVPARRVGAASPPIDPMAWSPPVQRPPAGANSPPVQFAQTAPARSGEGGRVRLCFDAVLGCYFDPATNRYRRRPHARIRSPHAHHPPAAAGTIN